METHGKFIQIQWNVQLEQSVFKTALTHRCNNNVHNNWIYTVDCFSW